MKISFPLICSFSIFVILILLSSLFCQDSTLTKLAISPRIGLIIDQEEREKFELFKGVDNFQSAQIYSMPDGRIQVQIKHINPVTGQEAIIIKYLSNSEIIQFQELIDHYEEIKKGEYTYSYQRRTNKTKSNFNIQDSLVTVELKDGCSFKGSIVNQDKSKLIFKTINGEEATIPKEMIMKIEPTKGKIGGGIFHGKVYFSYGTLIYPDESLPGIMISIGVGIGTKFELEANTFYWPDMDDAVISGNINYIMPSTQRVVAFATIGPGMCFCRELWIDMGLGLKIRLGEKLGIRAEYHRWSAIIGNPGHYILFGISFSIWN